MGIKFHFLNVGSGDCTIIHFPERWRKSDNVKKNERIMMVDCCHDEKRQQCEDVIKYYKKNFKHGSSIKSIFRFVCTHPHQDHICGLASLFNDNQISVCNFWDVKQKFEPEDFDGHETHEADWDTYIKQRNGVGGNLTVINTCSDDPARLYWNDDEDRITVLSPSQEMIDKAHKNKEDGSKRKPHEIDIDSISYALLIRVNNIKVVLAGDGREDVWDEIIKNHAEKIKDCDILKAGHHGQVSSFHEEAVKLMNPKHIIFSNSKGEDIANGASDEYKKAVPNAKIHKTFEEGTIVIDCGFDGTINLIKKDEKHYSSI